MSRLKTHIDSTPEGRLSPLPQGRTKTTTGPREVLYLYLYCNDGEVARLFSYFGVVRDCVG